MFRFVALILVLTASPLPLQASERTVDGFLLRERLPRFRPVVKVGSFSSRDRSGGNDDGFSGKDSFLRKEGDGLVVAELVGPGAITRIWTPTPTADSIEFYFDGEAEPRLRLPWIDLFRGKSAPFVPPLAYAGAGGYVSYVPMEFERSVKVVIRAPRVQFSQINYVLYAPGTPARTFQPGDGKVLLASALEGRKVTGRHVLEPGKAVKLFEATIPGRIESIKLGPAESFVGPERAVVLRIYWDGAETPAVEVPVGDFFGYAFGEPAMRSLLVGTEQGANVARLPMPFERSARLELVSEGAGGGVTIDSEVVVSDRGREAGEGYFHAVWRRENPTTPGRPFTFLDVEGKGHVVGVVLQAQGEEAGKTEFFEGDDEAVIDGELAIGGTGSEDFFNGGWYDLPGRWYDRTSFPFSGCLGYDKALSRTGGYRLMLADAYTFGRSLRLTIEHGPVDNQVPTDYTAVTYLYLDRPGRVGPPLAGVAERRVAGRDLFVLVPGWQAPLHAFSLDHATISRVVENLGGQNVRYLLLRQSGKPEIQGHYVAIAAEVPEGGRYVVSVEGITGPDEGMIQLLVEDQPVGQTVDLYAPERGTSGVRELAEIELSGGTVPLFIAMVGQNSQSSGKGFGLVRIHCKMLP